MCLSKKDAMLGTHTLVENNKVHYIAAVVNQYWLRKVKPNIDTLHLTITCLCFSNRSLATSSEWRSPSSSLLFASSPSSCLRRTPRRRRRPLSARPEPARVSDFVISRWATPLRYLSLMYESVSLVVQTSKSTGSRDKTHNHTQKRYTRTRIHSHTHTYIYII